MKTKTKLLTIILSAVISQQIKSQGVNSKWDKSGDAVSHENTKMGTTNNYGFNIITNNQTRANISKNGKFTFYGPIKTDTLKTDSLIVNGGARIKGRLHVGNNSLWLGGSSTGPGNDDITSTGGNINLGGETSPPFNLPFSQIRVGIGTQSPNQNLHIADNRTPSNAVRTQYTNFSTTSATGRGFLIGIFGNGNANLFQQEINRPLTFITQGGFVGVSNNNLAFLPTSLFHISDGASQTDMQVTNNATGNTATDGFKFGITNTGIAQVKQQENLDMQFHTNNLQRMVIKNAGRVGINTNTPGNRLTISSAAGDPYFGAASSGLRFTNMTSASPTILNPSNKVLSVDANGDVVLVPDGPGGGGGSGSTSVTAQNGLGNISPSIVEWGGTLLNDTF
jgi:hypothetical protein